MDIEIPTVYAASKRTQAATTAPASISVITAEEIRKFGYRTLADILRSVRGMYISYDRNYNLTGIRGFNRPDDWDSRILVLIDGQRFNEPVYNAGTTGTDFILDVDLIERVEVIRGPASSLYGSNAFFGVFNIVTRDASSYDGVEASGRVGSYDTYRGRLSYGKEFSNGISAVLSGTLYRSDGNDRLYFPEFDAPSTNNGVTENADGDEFDSIFAELSYYDFSLQGAYSERNKTVPTAPYLTFFPTDRTTTTEKSAYLTLHYNGDVAEETTLDARGYFLSYRYQGDYLYDWNTPTPPPFLVINKDDAEGEAWGGELHLTRSFAGKHVGTLGGEYRANV